MAIAYEKNTDLAFDTGILRKAATEYANVAEELRISFQDLVVPLQ